MVRLALAGERIHRSGERARRPNRYSSPEGISERSHVIRNSEGIVAGAEILARKMIESKKASLRKWEASHFGSGTVRRSERLC